MFDGVLDCWEGANNALVIGDFGVGLFVEGDVEVNLQQCRRSVCIFLGISSSMNLPMGSHTRMRTRLSFRSQSVIASLLERDMDRDLSSIGLLGNWGCNGWEMYGKSSVK